MLGRHTPPAPLEGEIGCCVLFDDEWFVAWVFPSREGIQGVCYGEMRGIGWDYFAAVR